MLTLLTLLLGRSLLHAHRRHALTMRGRGPGRLCGQVLLLLVLLLVRLLLVGVLSHGTHASPHPSLLAHSATHTACRDLTINRHASQTVSIALAVRVATARALRGGGSGEGE